MDYTANCLNQTDRTWTFVVFIVLPGSAGMDSVSWKQVAVPVSGSPSLTWNDEVAVCMGQITSDMPTIYRTTQILAAAANQRWKATDKDNVTQLVLTNAMPADPRTVEIRNETSSKLNLGYGQSGNGAVFAPDVRGNNIVAFYPVPSYWIMLSKSCAPGQAVLTSPSLRYTRAMTEYLPPQPIVFPTNVTTVTATASGTDVITLTLKYGSN